ECERREQTLRDWAEQAGLAVDDVRRRLETGLLYDVFERGQIGPAAFHRHVCDLLGVELEWPRFAEGWNAMLGRPVDGIDELLERLDDRLRLVVLSNTNETHAAIWRRDLARLLRHFEAVFTSHEIGARKPEPEAFQHVVEYLALPPEQIAFFDDRQSNIDAATALGLQARRVESPLDLRKHLQEFGVLE
ncbi:MAG: HAD family hydrolase, partial [Planctomycetota bacterium]